MKKILSGLLIMSMVFTLTACSSKSDDEKSTTKAVKDVKVSVLQKAAADALGDNYYPNGPTEGEDAADLVNITFANCDELIVDMPQIAMNADMIIIAKAKDGKVADVEKELKALRDTKIADQAQYPMNIPKTNASIVKTEGNYVFYIQLGGNAVDLEEEADIKAACEKDNNTAYEAIIAKLK